MRLSVRLVALGVSGPIVGLGMFLLLSTSTLEELGRRAGLELTAMFDQDNRTNLILTTNMIQRTARTVADQLNNDSDRLAQKLRPHLRVDSSGNLNWRGQPLPLAEAPRVLNPILAEPLTTRAESAGIFLRDNSGQWLRISGVDVNGHALATGWQPSRKTVHNVEALSQLSNGEFVASNSILKGNSGWRMTHLMPLDRDTKQRLLLAVSVRTDVADELLARSAALFPYKKHRVAFFGFTPSGKVYCTFGQPEAKTCDELNQLMQSSGGIPKPISSANEALSERSLMRASISGGPPQAQRLFIATFPSWNWLAVVLTEESLLNDDLLPLHRATMKLLLLLIGSTVVLIAGCGVAAWYIAAGIQRELRKLADAANEIAAGSVRTQLVYTADDALGRLIHAFNRMAAAVADREDSLRATIKTLEININQTALVGQVCTITKDPSFKTLSDRAQEMRSRRREQQRPTPAKDVEPQHPTD